MNPDIQEFDAKPAQHRSAVRGLCWMLVGTFCFASVTAIVRYVGPEVPAPQSAFLRFAFSLVFLLPLAGRFSNVKWSGGLAGLLLFRGIVHCGAVILWFYALARIPTAEVTAIGFIAPLFVVVGAALFFNEPIDRWRIGSLVVGLVGCLIILRPGFQQISYGQIAQLCAAPLFAVSFLVTKKLSNLISAELIVLALTGTVTVLLLPAAIAVWQPLDLATLAWLALAGLVATVAHYSTTKAMRLSSLSALQPLGLLQLLWATAIGSIIFQDLLDPFVLFGGLLVVAAATAVMGREWASGRVGTRQTRN